MLDRPGARLSYSLVGEGPLLVTIAGARGNGAIYGAMAKCLAGRFRVLTFDRRGYGQSPTTGDLPPDRLRRDADDVAALIEREGGPAGEPAFVFGSSSGAIVALAFLARHPGLVHRLVAHEPPAMTLLPEPQTALAGNDAMYEAYKTEGLQAAMGRFLGAMMSESDRTVLRAAASQAGNSEEARDRGARDIDLWFTHELRQYPTTPVDLIALASAGDRLAIAAGDDTRELPPHRIAGILATRLGSPLHILPGGHVGYLSRPEAFADALTPILAPWTASRDAKG